VRTTVTIDDRLLALAKQRAHEQHLTLGQLVERGLQAELMRPVADRGDLPELPTLAIGRMLPGIDPTSNASFLDAMDVDDIDDRSASA
jgi:hypothetical protein